MKRYAIIFDILFFAIIIGGIGAAVYTVLTLPGGSARRSHPAKLDDDPILDWYFNPANPMSPLSPLNPAFN